MCNLLTGDLTSLNYLK